MKIKESNVIHYTVEKLIESLKQFPQDLPVLVSGYEDGFENLLTPEKINLEYKAENQYWSGEFQETEQKNTKTSIDALVLRRVVRDI
ncbi:MAG: hypothetical protein Rsou_1983 [Candidatus Ruthia sp. Asou_11_S2]|nr:hypothetical protein [Candidatus Ruthia sp. Asou_11_S2]